MNILITGTSGYVGGGLALVLRNLGCRVWGLSRTRADDERVAAALEEQFLSDLNSLSAHSFQSYSFDLVFHAAALASSVFCEKDPEAAFMVNADGTAKVLQSCPEVPVVYFSTDFVFDGNESAPFDETVIPSPRSAYGKSKRAGEQLVESCEQVNGTIVRMSLVYGEEINGRRGALTWLLNALEKGEPVKLFEDEQRSPIALSDVCAASVALLKSKSRPQCIHLPGESVTRYEFGKLVSEVFSFPETLLEKASRLSVPGGEKRAADIRLASVFANQQPTSLRAALEELRQEAR